MIRAKAWIKSSDEPEAWTIEVPHAVPHLHGAPGVYAMSPQSKKFWHDDQLSHG